MKYIYLLTILFGSQALLNAQTTFCLNLRPVTNTETELVVALEINGNQEFDLGTSNLQFGFDPDVLSNPRLEQDGLPGPPFYQPSTVTEPSTGQASYNIELGFADFGSTMSGPEGWTEVGQVRFDKNSMNFDMPLSWSYNGGTTQTVMFLDDEATQIFATSNACLEGISAAALPVAYEQFTATALDKTTLLEWKTQAETENSGFHIMRSQDGDDYEKIDFVPGSNSAAAYDFVDLHPFSGLNYYRLMQEDYDGTTTLSEVRTVLFNTVSNEIGIYPNPATDLINVTGLPPSESNELNLYDVQGRQVASSTGTAQLKVGTLANGTYLLEMISGTTTSYERVVIAR